MPIPPATTWRFSPSELKRRRLLADLTQAALAEAAGLSTRAIETLETGARQPGSSTVARLAPALRCRPGDLFERVEEAS
jgi:transcriptional regulator with XRE-family HTH domain